MRRAGVVVSLLSRSMRRAGVVASLLSFLLAAASVLPAQSLATVLFEGLLRPEWTVKRTAAGRAQVVGYIYNDNGLRKAANVRLRVEQLTTTGTVANAYQSFVVGDVQMNGRMPFEVSVADSDATYRVTVESVDWLMECR